MSKTIELTYTNGPRKGNHYKLSCDAFVRAVRDPAVDLRDSPSAWVYAGLLCFTDSGEVILSPRGEDLLASIDSIPDDPEPAEPVCQACGNTGKVYIIGDFANDCTEPGCPAVSTSEQAAKAVHSYDPSRVTIKMRDPLTGNLLDVPHHTALRRIGMGYSAVWPAVTQPRTLHGARFSISSEALEWQTAGLPDIGREVEVVIVTGGETLRGRAAERDEATCALFLAGEKSAPAQYRPADGWWTRPDASDSDDRRLRWRYVS